MVINDKSQGSVALRYGVYVLLQTFR